MDPEQAAQPSDPGQPSRLLTLIKLVLACGILIFLFLQIQPKLPYLSTLYNKLKDYTKQDAPEPTKESPEIKIKSSGNTIETPKPEQKGFCYAGEWEGSRSCIDVNSLDECYSGEMYDSKIDCTNKK